MSVASIHTGEQSATADNAAVLHEIWISFVSLWRSHLAALQTLGKFPQVTVVETSPNSLIVGNLDGNIAVTLNPADGHGSYEMKSCGEPSAKGLWQLQADGRTSVDDGPLEDMELAVEFFAQRLLAVRLKGTDL